ncbi:MAG: hypothetical protein EA406_14580, partial [Rhodospirillales bacterium]
MALSAPAAHAGIVFTGLGTLGGSSSRAFGVSADGSVVVGQSSSASGPEAFRWTADGGMVGLGILEGRNQSVARAVSADGSVVVGQSSFNHWPSEAFRWTADGGMVGLGGGVEGGTYSSASGVSADGSVVVGSSGGEAFRWTADGGMVGLGGWRTSAVSADGSVVVGFENFGVVFRWTEADGKEEIYHVFNYDGDTTAFSADGLVVVGWTDHGCCGSSAGRMAFRWTADGRVDRLGGLEGLFLPPWYDTARDRSLANAVSADGSVVVGQAWPWSHTNFQQVFDEWGYYWQQISAPDAEAFLWDEAAGMRSLRNLLIDDYALGEALTGWSLSDATGISADGRTIVGYGFNPSGETEAWLLRLPAAPAEIPVPAALPL